MYDNHKLDLILAVGLGVIGFHFQLPSQIYVLLFSLEGVALSSPKKASLSCSTLFYFRQFFSEFFSHKTLKKEAKTT